MSFRCRRLERRALCSCAASVYALLLVAPRLVSAQRVGTGRAPSIDEAVATALLRNPDLGVAQTLVDSARAEVGITRALPNPTYAGIPGTPYQYSIALPLDVGPQRFYRSRFATLGADAAGADRRDAARQLTFSVRRAFLDVLLADTLESISRERRELVRQMLVADSARYHGGDIAARELYRVEGELARADADLARSHVAAMSARVALQTLMGLETLDTALAVAGALRFAPLDPPDDSSLVALSTSRRPDAVASMRRVEQSRAQRQLAVSNLFPVPQLSYVRQRAAPFEDGRYYAFGVAVEVPILNQYSAQRQRAAAGEASALLAQRRVTAAIRRDVAAASVDFRAQRALSQRLQSGLLARTDAGLTATRYAYSRGAASLLDVLDAARTQQDVRVDYFTALRDYWVAAYALDAAVGTDVLADHP